MASPSSSTSTEKTKLCEDFPACTPPVSSVDDEPVEEVDIEEAIERAGCGWGTLLYTAGCVFFASLEGAEVIMLTIVAPILRCEWNLSPFLYAVLLMSTLLAMTIAGLITAPFGDKFGRKPVAVVCAVGMTVCGLLSAFSQAYWQFLALRILLGMFMGTGSGPIIALSGEVAPKVFRALAISVLPIPWALGVFVGALLAYLLIEPYGWQGLLLAIALIFSPCILFLCLVDESPRYDYCYRRDKAAAEKTIQSLVKYNRRKGKEAQFKLRDPDSSDTKVTNFRMVYHTLKETGNILNGITIGLYAVFAVFNYYLYAYITPRILNEGYCEGSIVSVEKSCVFEKEVLLDIAVVSIASPVGELTSLFLQHFFGRRKVFIAFAAGTAIIPFALYHCVSYTYLVTFLVILRGFLDATTLAHHILMAEYMPTVIRSFMLTMTGVMGRTGGVVASFTSDFIYLADPRLAIGLIQVMGVMCVACFAVLRRETAGADLQ